MTLDTRARALASRMLATYGKACTLKHVTAGTYSADTASVSVTTVSYAIQAYLDEPNQRELQDAQVLTTDEVAIFPALGLTVEPAPNDSITVDGTDRLVKKVGRVWSGEQVALWRAVLRS